MLQPSQQHVAPCVKLVKSEFGTRGNLVGSWMGWQFSGQSQSSLTKFRVKVKVRWQSSGAGNGGYYIKSAELNNGMSLKIDVNIILAVGNINTYKSLLFYG